MWVLILKFRESISRDYTLDYSTVLPFGAPLNFKILNLHIKQDHTFPTSPTCINLFLYFTTPTCSSFTPVITNHLQVAIHTPALSYPCILPMPFFLPLFFLGTYRIPSHPLRVPSSHCLREAFSAFLKPMLFVGVLWWFPRHNRFLRPLSSLSWE